MKTTAHDAERIRRAVSEREFSTSQLSAEVRAEATAYARRRVAEGATHATIAAEIGVSMVSVGRWLRAVESAALVPVHVIAERAQSTPTFDVVTPRGLRVVGLDMDALCTLLERHG